jgi:peptidoglycan/xylan/chitin deacetylase (PgdA/CDA1 family)
VTFPPARHPARKIPCALLVLAIAAILAPAAHAAPRGGRPARIKSPYGLLSTSGSMKIDAASVVQRGRGLVLSVRTARPVALAKLTRRPDTRRAGIAYLCFGFAEKGAGETRLCLGGPKAHKRAGLVTVDSADKPLTRTAIVATLKRPKPTKLVLSVDDGPTNATGLAPGHYSWQVLAPGTSTKARPFRLRPVRAVGCTGGSAELVTNADTDRKVVALTFDDGPSEYTDRYLDVLREKGVPGTFFEIGQEMPGREATMRRILREGDEIGDHTENHVEYPGYAQIADAANRIEEYTGFTPCLFRPPGGAVNSSVIATAGSLRMKTITWDVDPRDWSLPGTEEIYSNITSNAGPGSIILMHDGGGPRDETLAALPRIIDTLRARGYGFETVSALLGDEILYRPFG